MIYVSLLPGFVFWFDILPEDESFHTQITCRVAGEFLHRESVWFPFPSNFFSSDDRYTSESYVKLTILISSKNRT
jgi:hypothetical protein